MKRALVVGGANGIGLSIATLLAQRDDVERVDIIDKVALAPEHQQEKMHSTVFDLCSPDYSILDKFRDVNVLMITAGFGRLALFRDIAEEHISQSFQVNTIAAMRIVHHFMPQLQACDDFYCGIMVSIAGFMSSPFFSVYAATKAALKVFIESVNVELEKNGSANCIMNVSPGSIRGTSFNQGSTDLSLTQPLAQDIITHLFQKDDLFIPQYDEVFREVLERYHSDFRAEGRHSYDYKAQSGRLSTPKS